MKAKPNKTLTNLTIIIATIASLSGGVASIDASSSRPHARDLLGNRTSHRINSLDGYLLVYSATDESSDGDMQYYAPSPYVIYTNEGRRFRNIDNHMGRSDELPALVSLPPGSYTVEARSTNNGYVRVPVVIKPYRRTIVHLDTVREGASQYPNGKTLE